MAISNCRAMNVANIIRPPPELIKTAELHGKIGVASNILLPVPLLRNDALGAILNAEQVVDHHSP